MISVRQKRPSSIEIQSLVVFTFGRCLKISGSRLSASSAIHSSRPADPALSTEASAPAGSPLISRPISSSHVPGTAHNVLSRTATSSTNPLGSDAAPQAMRGALTATIRPLSMQTLSVAPAGVFSSSSERDCSQSRVDCGMAAEVAA